MPNSYPDEVNPQELFSFLKELNTNGKVQEILVCICEIDENWPYADSIYIYTSLTEPELEKEFGKYLPDEIYEGWMYDEPNGTVEIVSPNKVYTILWD